MNRGRWGERERAYLKRYKAVQSVQQKKEVIGLFGGGDDDWKEDCIGTVGCRTFLTFSLERECQVEAREVFRMIKMETI